MTFDFDINALFFLGTLIENITHWGSDNDKTRWWHWIVPVAGCFNTAQTPPLQN